MQVEITITINVPDNGTTPVIKVNNKTTKLEIKTPIQEPKLSKPSLTRGLGKATTKPQGNYFNGKPKSKLAERKCLQCGHKFVPNTHNHKFDTKKCKDTYNYKQNHEGQKPIVVPKKDVATKKQKRMHGSEVLFSKDPFYVQQLQKAHKQHGSPYSRYVSENEL
jgi:hypothetical protein